MRLCVRRGLDGDCGRGMGNVPAVLFTNFELFYLFLTFLGLFFLHLLSAKRSGTPIS